MHKTADQAMREHTEVEAGPTALDEAKAYLQQRLAAGPSEAKVVLADAKRSGVARRTLDRAKAALGVRAEKSTGEVHGGWIWRLPA